ncbi:hypothetical protein PM10SUCC1_25280 [Propionigenium maris DSM 9537]|uniref:Uncharacterized protein n=1 Tax=Propionigenium maris DSM 9537 TaxID=1123000 RepID=A0A9W6GNF3_9FUSO|nr:hypothetical protein [Propionigenium maris]GLI57014.1 hypothetical protein PM10SUCC1_25280 [Propionigenium maris DSM 9537]
MKKILISFMAVFLILSSGEVYARANGNGNGNGGGGGRESSGRDDNRGGGNRGGNSDRGGNREGSGRSDKGRDNKGNSEQKKTDRKTDKVNKRENTKKKEAASQGKGVKIDPKPGNPIERPKPTHPVEKPKPSNPIERPRPSHPVERPKPSNPIEGPKPSHPIERPKPTHPVERPKPSHPIEGPAPEHPIEKPTEVKDAHKNWGKLKREESFDSKTEEKARKEEIKAERTVRRNFRMSGIDGDVDQAVNDYVNGRLTSEDLRNMGVTERGIWHSERAVDKYERSLDRIGYERPEEPDSPKPENPIEGPRPEHPIERPTPENPIERPKPTNPIS